MTIRIAVLGGSAVVTPQLAAALADEPDLSGGQIELVLIGRNREKLARVVDASTRVSQGGGSHCSVTVTGETDVAAGVRDARFIVNQVRAGGLAGRAFDERFPHELGLPGEETMGPGGFANAWRTLPLVHDLFMTCRSAAPEAKLLNLTNPAGMVHQVAREVGLDVLTLCDSPLTLASTSAQAAGIDPAVAEPGYLGTNHGGWLTALRVDGEDVLPRALEHADELGDRLGFDSELLLRLHAVPNVYLRYLYYPERMLETQRAKGRPRAEELIDLETSTLDAYGTGDDPRRVAEKRRALWYTECIVPAVGSIVSGRRRTTIAGVTNETHVPWLPPETMLELPVHIEGDEVHVLAVEPLPVDASALLLANAAYEKLAVDAVLHGDRGDLVRALAANPLVPSVDVAARAVELIEREFGKTDSTAR
jgi:6-phospho-beta-glucosidase